jgi:hypothetical protein
MKKYFHLLLFTSMVFVSNAQEEPKWQCDAGFSFFKTSVNNQPDELLFNPVFVRWENINQQPAAYTVEDYKPLNPFQFNASFGLDCFFKYKKYFMIKLGINYTNNLGIGGDGKISYTDNATDIAYTEKKVQELSTFQINYFIGPCIPIGEHGPEIFMGFSLMSPTWVSFREKYTQTRSSNVLIDYDKTFKGFFGNCRTMIGMQVPVSGHFKLGTELVWAYFNGIELKSGSITDQGFKFPTMQWNFTIRYKIK